MRILKGLLRFSFLFAAVSFAADAIDAEIVKNLDFYMYMDVIQNLDLATHLDKDGTFKMSPAVKPSGTPAGGTSK